MNPTTPPSPPPPLPPAPPEPIYVVLADPVLEAVHDELAHHGVVAVEGVAAAAVVVVLTPGGKHVVHAVVQAPAQCGGGGAGCWLCGHCGGAGCWLCGH